jgi:hypothetical protein
MGQSRFEPGNALRGHAESKLHPVLGFYDPVAWTAGAFGIGIALRRRPSVPVASETISFRTRDVSTAFAERWGDSDAGSEEVAIRPARSRLASRAAGASGAGATMAAGRAPLGNRGRATAAIPTATTAVAVAMTAVALAATAIALAPTAVALAVTAVALAVTAIALAPTAVALAMTAVALAMTAVALASTAVAMAAIAIAAAATVRPAAPGSGIWAWDQRSVFRALSNSANSARSRAISASAAFRASAS